MSVHATYCRLCALPVQHDHYVVAARDLPVGPRYKIYRRVDDQPWAVGEAPYRFDKRHGWLCDAVAVHPETRAVVPCLVEDGEIHPLAGTRDEPEMAEDFAVYHSRCWDRLGAAQTALPSHEDSYEVVWLKPYQGQLFEFHELAQDGGAWALEDPADGGRSSERLDRLVDMVTRPRESGPGWRGVAVRDGNGGRFRIDRWRDVGDAAEQAAFPSFLRVWKDDKPRAAIRPELEALEREIKQVVEETDGAVFVAAWYQTECAEYIAYCRDAAETSARLRGIDRVAREGFELETVADPTWQKFRDMFGA